MHIDWLSVSEEHAVPVDDFGAGVVLSLDMDGAAEWQSVRGAQVRGSWDSSLRVRASGGRVEVSGNPSRWGRLDALDGLDSVDACLMLYNRVLRDLDLPPFSGRLERLRVSEGSQRGQVYYRGTRISQIHLTRNLVLGSPLAVRPWLDWIASQRWGRKGLVARQHVENGTVAFGSRVRREQTYYNKGAEIGSHVAEVVRHLPAADRVAAAEYLQRLADWCSRNGVVRDELRLGRKVLPELGLEWAANWRGLDLAEIERDSIPRGGASVIDWTREVIDRVESVLGSRAQARTAEGVLMRWLNGCDVRAEMTPRTFRRYARALREACGVDIRCKPNVVSMGRKMLERSVGVEARELRSEDLPEWYRRAA